MTTDFRNSRETAQNGAGRKRWSRPELIHSKVSRKTQKGADNIGYEYHEVATPPSGGGTTQIS